MLGSVRRMSAPTVDGKVAVVTGSGQGLGRAYAVALADAGAAVVVNDIDDAAAAETVALITDAGGRAVSEIAAIGEADAAEAVVDRAVSEFGRLDVIVTNAGLLRDKVLWNMSDEDFDVVIRTHLRGTFTCGRAAAIRMREQGEGGASSWLAPPPDSSLPSARPTTPRRRPASSRSHATGRWSWPAPTSPSTRSSPRPGRRWSPPSPSSRPWPSCSSAANRCPRRCAVTTPSACRGLRAPGRVPRLRRGVGDHRAGDRPRGGPADPLFPSGCDRGGYRDGGWDAASIAQAWEATLAEKRQILRLRRRRSSSTGRHLHDD